MSHLNPVEMIGPNYPNYGIRLPKSIDFALHAVLSKTLASPIMARTTEIRFRCAGSPEDGVCIAGNIFGSDYICPIKVLMEHGGTPIHTTCCTGKKVGNLLPELF